MASVKEYFENDFPYAVKFLVDFGNINSRKVHGAVLYDFSAYSSFISIYLSGSDNKYSDIESLINSIKPGGNVVFNNKIILPSARAFGGTLSIKNNKHDIDLHASFFGDPEEISYKKISTSRRIFIYSDTELSEREMISLKKVGLSNGHKVQFRLPKHASERSKMEKPLAFISHDSRDKDQYARKIAFGLNKFICPVWYDEYSLKVGDRLRESIENGLKNCKKCVIVLSRNFFSNPGWTAREFDAIFMREII